MYRIENFKESWFWTRRRAVWRTARRRGCRNCCWSCFTWPPSSPWPTGWQTSWSMTGGENNNKHRSIFFPTQGPCDGWGQNPRGWESKRVAEKTDGVLHIIVSTGTESFRALDYFCITFWKINIVHFLYSSWKVWLHFDVHNLPSRASILCFSFVPMRGNFQTMFYPIHQSISKMNLFIMKV